MDERAWVYPRRVFVSEFEPEEEAEHEHTGPVSIPDDSADSDDRASKQGQGKECARRCRRWCANAVGVCMVVVQLAWLWLLVYAIYKVGQLVSRTG